MPNTSKTPQDSIPRAVPRLYPLHLVVRRTPQWKPARSIRLGTPSPLAHCSSYIESYPGQCTTRCRRVRRSQRRSTFDESTALRVECHHNSLGGCLLTLVTQGHTLWGTASVLRDPLYADHTRPILPRFLLGMLIVHIAHGCLGDPKRLLKAFVKAGASTESQLDLNSLD